MIRLEILMLWHKYRLYITVDDVVAKLEVSVDAFVDKMEVSVDVVVDCRKVVVWGWLTVVWSFVGYSVGKNLRNLSVGDRLITWDVCWEYEDPAGHHPTKDEKAGDRSTKYDQLGLDHCDDWGENNNIYT